MPPKQHKKDCKSKEISSTEQKCEILIKQTEKLVNDWEGLKQSGVDVETLQQTLGVSRATFYRKRNLLQNLFRRIFPPSKGPKNVHKRCWTEVDRRLVMKIRSEKCLIFSSRRASLLYYVLEWVNLTTGSKVVPSFDPSFSLRCLFLSSFTLLLLKNLSSHVSYTNTTMKNPTSYRDGI